MTLENHLAPANQRGAIGEGLPIERSSLRFIVFTCRDTRTDFRLPLVEALRRRGHDVHYVWLKRRPVVSGPLVGDSTISMNLASCIWHLRRVTTARNCINIYFTSTNLCFPPLIFALKALCGRGIWCFDMHDDLLAGFRGLAAARARVAQALLLPLFDLMVHAAPTLKELFPASHHLGNASSLGLLKRRMPGFDKVLILASIDGRMDFNFVEAVAARCPEFDFDVYGQVSPDVQAPMQVLCRARPNVHYHGAYVMADLVPILERYTVMLAPYRIDGIVTRYIDPLRYYHALNSGTEIITTAISQAEAYADRLHIVRTPGEAALALKGLHLNRIVRRNADGAPPITWDGRAAQLIEILMAAPCAQALVAAM